MTDNQTTRPIPKPRASTSPEAWERETLEKLVFASLTEQRRTRRWNVFFKALFFLYMLVVAVAALSPLKTSLSSSTSHTAVIDIAGVIASDSEANADHIVGALRDAFEDKGSKAIILRLNTPGGSPVQSDYIYREIRRLRDKNPDIPVYAVITDICASGGYYIAAAADKIFVNPASIVGSIGVIMNGFGFVNSMEKLGVERRLLTAGSNKALMDPFLPVNKTQQAHMAGLLRQVHAQFIQAVRTGRGERLQEHPDLFTGLVWTGEESIKLGLTDAVGSTGSVARDIVGEEKIVNFTPQEDFLQQMTKQLGTALEHVLFRTTAQMPYRLQ